jgi:hypothetical protein
LNRVIFQYPSRKSIGLDCARWISPSDPHAWLRPYYIALKADGGLQKLAIPTTVACAAPWKPNI